MLAAGVPVTVKDSHETQNTPLHWAASYGNRDVINCLCCKFFYHSLVSPLIGVTLHSQFEIFFFLPLSVL